MEGVLVALMALRDRRRSNLMKSNSQVKTRGIRKIEPYCRARPEKEGESRINTLIDEDDSDPKEIIP